MRHFLIMMLFAAMAAVIFGAMSKDTPRERWIDDSKSSVSLLLSVWC